MLRQHDPSLNGTGSFALNLPTYFDSELSAKVFAHCIESTPTVISKDDLSMEQFSNATLHQRLVASLFYRLYMQLLPLVKGLADANPCHAAIKFATRCKA